MNGLDSTPWSWLLILAFGPVVSAGLAFEMHRAFRDTGRAMRAYDILLVVFVTPQFLGAVWVWRVLLHYM